MSRQARDLQVGYCYHITVRCNNREFKLLRHECREVCSTLLTKVRKNLVLSSMSNHVHYLLKPSFSSPPLSRGVGGI